MYTTGNPVVPFNKRIFPIKTDLRSDKIKQK